MFFCDGCARDATVAFGAGHDGLILAHKERIARYLRPQRPTPVPEPDRSHEPFGGRHKGKCFVCLDRERWGELTNCTEPECTIRGETVCFECINFTCASGHLYIDKCFTCDKR